MHFTIEQCETIRRELHNHLRRTQELIENYERLIHDSHHLSQQFPYFDPLIAAKYPQFCQAIRHLEQYRKAIWHLEQYRMALVELVERVEQIREIEDSMILTPPQPPMYLDD